MSVSLLLRCMALTTLDLLYLYDLGLVAETCIAVAWGAYRSSLLFPHVLRGGTLCLPAIPTTSTQRRVPSKPLSLASANRSPRRKRKSPCSRTASARRACSRWRPRDALF